MTDRVLDLRNDGHAGGVTTEEKTDSAGLIRRIATLEEENAELRLQLAVLASTDAATGLANRIGLLDAIEMATYRLARMQEPFAVVLLRFPQLDALTDDDEYLEAIRDIGSLLAGGVRSVDRVGRIESSTFVSVLANIPFEHVDVVLERTKASLSAVAASAGVAGERIAPQLLAVSMTDASSDIDASSILDRCHGLMDDGSAAEIRTL